MSPIRTIIHPTDFSAASAEAFAHALRIALAEESTLYLLHVAEPGDDTDWSQFPHVRATLARWGLMDKDAPAATVAELGIRVAKLGRAPQATVNAILHFLASHSADLIVLATEGRDGVARWLHGSVAEHLARHAKVPTLFVPARAPGFVDPESGDIHIRHVLIPIDHHPRPASAVGAIAGLLDRLAGRNKPEEHFLHVGRHAPQIQHHAKLGPAANGDHARRRRGGSDPDGGGRMAGRSDRHADRRPSRFSRRLARLHQRARAAPGALPVADGAGVYLRRSKHPRPEMAAQVEAIAGHHEHAVAAVVDGLGIFRRRAARAPSPPRR